MGMSPVLEKALTSPMKEATERVIQMKGFHPEAVKEILRYAYGGRPDFSCMDDAIVHDIFRGSHM